MCYSVSKIKQPRKFPPTASLYFQPINPTDVKLTGGTKPKTNPKNLTTSIRNQQHKNNIKI